jgi:hypothetical protein
MASVIAATVATAREDSFISSSPIYPWGSAGPFGSNNRRSHKGSASPKWGIFRRLFIPREKENSLSSPLAPVSEPWHDAGYPGEGDVMSRREFLKRGMAAMVVALLLLITGCDGDGGDDGGDDGGGY